LSSETHTNGAVVRESDVLNWTVGKFTNATSVGWKNEDEVDGVAVGPVWIQTSSGQETAPSWYPLADAQALATELGVPCEEW
jgi:hypothetical protein